MRYATLQSEKDEGELLEESTRIRRLKLGAENQRREYAKEIIELKDVLRQAQEQAELLRSEANAMQDVVDQAQNSVNGRQVLRAHILQPQCCNIFPPARAGEVIRHAAAGAEDVEA